ncbi:energy-coupling factor transporter transmembrane component T family protein [Liquorilactobacillus uvarum]|uniref:energy-coupling factor transporter transmembrane component T family protein n=1 Tax=Liquorilactobacillus uvarum TaxID=303240 RepID=UPI0007105C80|nr:energy-coupling factor transporter transmembrane protein EcfT [Liquorilactobacillus uvarum]
MNKVILGRYIPGKSIIHRLDPRSKLILSFYFIIVIFLANNWQTYALLSVFTVACVLLSKVSFSFFLKGVRPLIWLILFTVILQVFFSRGGTVYWQFGPLSLTSSGVINGSYVFCRFVLIIFMSTLLTLTTAPLEIADALESLMSPLKKIKVPVYEISLMLSIALRFVPTLMDETEKIMNAQRSRGVNFGEGSIMQQIKAVVPLLIPLFVSSFNRAEDLATAMEARGYRGGEGRTKYRVHFWRLKDTLACVAFVFLTTILLYLRNW